jgi:hypothetical protein
MDPITGLHLRGHSVPIAQGASARVAIDSGTSLFSGPQKEVTTFWNSVGGVPFDQLPGFFQYRVFKFFYLSFHPVLIRLFLMFFSL